MQLEQPAPTGGGHPSVTFTDFGMGVQLAVVKVDKIQSRDYETGQPATWDDGSPKEETRFTGIVAAGDAQIGLKDEKGDPALGPDGKRTYRTVEPGEVVCCYFKGDAEKAYYAATRGKLTEVGMLVGIKHDAVKPPKNPNWNPTKLFSFTVAPNPDQAMVAEAVELAKAAKAVPLADPFPAAGAANPMEAAF